MMTTSTALTIWQTSEYSAGTQYLCCLRDLRDLCLPGSGTSDTAVFIFVRHTYQLVCTFLHFRDLEMHLFWVSDFCSGFL